MNVQLKDITVTARDGRVSHLDQVYIRGSHVKFFIVPDMLRFATTISPSYKFIGYWGMGNANYYRIGTLPCSAHEASAVAVSVLLVVRPRCRGRGDRDGVKKMIWILVDGWMVRRYYFVLFKLLSVCLLFRIYKLVLSRIGLAVWVVGSDIILNTLS